MLNVLTAAHNPVVDNFEMAKTELKKYSIEARENVRFLSTLERHFKNLQHTNDFTVINDTIPSMMNSLRMVWIISRHYNKVRILRAPKDRGYREVRNFLRCQL